MLIRTHLAVAFFVGLLLVIYFDFFSGLDKIIFLVLVLLATYIPDVDSQKSKLGKRFFFRPLQFFVKHRDFFHSFIFMILISGFIFFISEVAFYGFLIGYLIHLIVDCFSVGGVRIFWPAKFRVRGFVKTNGILEWLVFSLFFCLGIVLLIDYFLISIF